MKHLKTNLFSRSFPKSPVVPAQYVIFGRCIIDLVFYFTYLHALANTVALLIFQTFKSYPGAAHIRRKPTSSQPEVKEGGKTYVVALKLKKIRVGECLPVHPMIDAQLSLSLSLSSRCWRRPTVGYCIRSVGRSRCQIRRKPSDRVHADGSCKQSGPQETEAAAHAARSGHRSPSSLPLSTCSPVTDRNRKGRGPILPRRR